MNHKFYDFTIIVCTFFFLIFNILISYVISSLKLIHIYIDDSQLISFNFLSEIINLIKL